MMRSRLVLTFALAFAPTLALAAAALRPLPARARPPEGAEGLRQTSAAGFGATVETDAATGWPILVLRHRDAARPAEEKEVRIAPQAGANLFSLKVGGEELLLQPEKLADLKLNRTGTPLLFPTPNRVRDAVFTFEGHTFRFEPNNKANYIHGFARHRAWSFEPPVATKDAATAKLALDWSRQDAAFASFPIEHRLEITYSLRRDGVRIAYTVHNRDRRRLPFGFGLHPWFRVPGAREDVLLEVPATHRMEAEEQLPTGKLLPVEGTPYDLSPRVPLAQLGLDDVYTGLRRGRAPSFELVDRGLQVELASSPEFTHVVVFTPKDRPTFCIENQTSSTDAHNLHAKGLRKEAHLQVIPPGKTARGAVDWRVTKR
jgi:aldose 1-epimerase